MRKASILFTILLLSCTINAQSKFNVNDYANFEKYKEANMKLGLPTDTEERVVFMGNSITEAWKELRPEFFEENGYICRGISGQVTQQMLLRFRTDVIDLRPKAVVILAGTNDIAQNSGFVPLENIADNIFSMAELADYHRIKVILCSVLPAIDYPWHPGLEPAPKIIKLNEMIKNYASEKGFRYVDYYSSMADDEGGLKVPEYTSKENLVHPNVNGYKVMEKLVNAAIEKELGK